MTAIRRSPARLGLLVSYLLLHFWSPVASQISTGLIDARAVDRSGKPLPGVLMIATSTETGLERAQPTGPGGRSLLLALPPGPYEVRATLAGHRSEPEAIDAEVRIGQSLQLRFVMWSADVTRVIVTAEPPLLNATKAELNTVVTQERIERHPLLNRNFTDLAKFAPGVKASPGGQVDPGFTPGVYDTFTTGGTNGRNTNLYVDGFTNQNVQSGSFAYGFPADAIAEFEIIQDQHKAEFGRASGAVINVVTRSGTNDYEGSVFGVLRGDNTRSTSFSEELAGADKQESDRQQYGITFGGPLIRDRLHFFIAAERQAEERPIGLSRRLTSNAGSEPAGYPFRFPRPGSSFVKEFERDLFTAKLTWSPVPSHRFWVRYNEDRFEFLNLIEGTRTHPTSNRDQENEASMLVASWTWVAPNSAVNEVTVGRVRTTSGADHTSRDSRLTLRYDSFDVGRSLSAPQGARVEALQFRDDLTWTRGSHTFKTGLEVIRVEDEGRPEEFRLDKTPVLFVFNPAIAPAGSMATGQASGLPGTDPNNGVDDGLDIVSAALFFTGGQAPPYEYTQYASYLQDDWEINRRWRVHLGLRVDHIRDIWQAREGVLEDMYECMADPGSNRKCQRDPSTVNAPRGFEPYGRTFPREPVNVAPRLGFVYRVGGGDTDVIRGSWGLYYDQVIKNIFQFNNQRLCEDCFPQLPVLFGCDPANLGTCSSRTNMTAGSVVIPALPPLPADFTLFNWVNDPNLRAWVDQLSSIQGPARLTQDNNGGLEILVSPDWSTPYTSAFSVGWGHAFSENLVFDTNFIYRRGFHQMRWESFNGRSSGREAPWPAVTDPNTGVASYSGGVTILTTDGKAEYTSLQLSLRGRTGKYDFGANLNLSEATATQDAGGTGFFTADEGPIDLFDGGNIKFTGGDVDSEWGRVSGNQAVYLFLYGAYRFPLGFSLAGELAYGSRVTVHGTSGNVDLNGDGFPPWTFPLNEEYAGGRGGGLGGDLFNIDLRVSKTFEAGKGITAEVFLDVFNLTDHDNYSTFVSHRQFTSVGGNIRRNPGYLEPLGNTLTPPRTLQLGTRISFGGS